MNYIAIRPMLTEEEIDPLEKLEAQRNIPNLHHYLGARRFASHDEIMAVACDDKLDPKESIYSYADLRRDDSLFIQSQAASHEEALEVLHLGIGAREYRFARQYGSHAQVLAIHQAEPSSGFGLTRWTLLRRWTNDEEAQEVLDAWIDTTRYAHLRHDKFSHRQAMDHIRAQTSA